MKKLSELQWSDLKGRFQNNQCPFCKHQDLDFSEPRYGCVGGVDIVSISCAKRGHVQVFDVGNLVRIANDIDADYRRQGWRQG